MLPTRTKDSINNTEKLVQAQAIEIKDLRQHVLELKKLVREVKETVTRKYTK